MRTINNNDLDLYLYIKEFVKENGISPTYREITKNTNYNSIAGVRHSIDKLEDLKFIKSIRDENDRVIARSIKIIDNEYTKKEIKKLRDKSNE